MRLLFAALALLLGSAPDAQQGLLGSVVGVVTDSSGGVLPGVTITAVDSRTDETYRAVSDRDGKFELTRLLAGEPYSVRAELPGFAPEERSVTARPGQVITWNVALRIPTVRPVESFVDDFTGTPARNCGRFLLGDTSGPALRQAISCAHAASADRVRFATIQQRIGLDSRRAIGLMGRGDASIYGFEYRQSPVTQTTFTVRKCETLDVVEESPSSWFLVCT